MHSVVTTSCPTASWHNVWPTAGGTKFKFRFRPRFAIHAKSAPSLLYDYYNPDANVVVAPVNFNVQSAAREATSAGN